MKPARIVVFIAAALLLAAATPFALSWYESSPVSWPKEPFDPGRWKSMEKTERFRQFRSLDADGLLLGKTAEQVHALIGAPDASAPDGSYDKYLMKSGSADRWTMNSVYYMRVRYGANHVVSSLQVYGD
jgi:hypothetical protein